MKCLLPICSAKIPVLRRVAKRWFCSEEHYLTARDQGILDEIDEQRDNRNRASVNNPLTPTRCHNCGKDIPLEKRLRGHWYCSEDCHGKQDFPPPDEPGEGWGRDAFIGMAALGLAGAAALWVSGPSAGLPEVPGVTTVPRDWIRDRLQGLFPREYTISLGDQAKLMGQWAAPLNAWRQIDGIWQPLRSMTSSLVSRLPNGTLEFTAQGGIGFLFRATADLSSYHSMAFRPVKNRAGRVLDYHLHRATRVGNQPASEWKKLPLGLGPEQVNDEDSFRVVKRGGYFEACVQAPDGGWTIADRWRETTLPEGGVGLFVDKGHDYRIVSGRISA